MRFFTPELLLSLHTEDEAAYDRASANWSKVSAAYRKHTTRILPALRASNAVAICETVALHDARVLEIQELQQSRLLVLVVQLEGTAGQSGAILSIQYSLAHTADPAFVRSSVPALLEQLPAPVILNDEFDVEGDWLTHSILLTGYHYLIRFTTVQVRKLGESVHTIPATNATQEYAATNGAEKRARKRSVTAG